MAFDLSYMAYLNAKKAPTIKPGAEIMSIEPPPTDSASSTANAPEASEAIMSIRSIDFVAANSSDLAGYMV